MLTLAVKSYGTKNWIKIQAHVPGRTDVQFRERWVNILNPVLNNGPWADEEDNKLRQAIATHGLGKWALVASILHPRTDNQCWRRWKALNQEDVEGYKRTIYKKRTGLVNNFVGREKERPDLTPEDFEIDEEAVATQAPRPMKKRKRACAQKSDVSSSTTQTLSQTTSSGDDGQTNSAGL